MRFELPIPYRAPVQMMERDRGGVARWSRSQTVYRHFDRRKFETWIASTTTPPPSIAGSVRAPGGFNWTEASYLERAKDLLDRQLGAPAGMGQLMVMDVAGVQEYLGIEAQMREMPEASYVRGEWRYAGSGSREYQIALEKLRWGRAQGVRSLDELLRLQNSQLERVALEKAYRTAVMRGDFNFDDTVLFVPWRSVRRMALAMGGISETQYGLLATGLSTERVSGDLMRWEKDGKLVCTSKDTPDLPRRYVVSEPEAEEAIQEGDLTRDEYDLTAQTRTRQRDHDEAVGDAMMLLGMSAHEVGLTVEYVVPESRIVAPGREGLVPDFVIGIGDGYGVSDYRIEVVGRGGAYRQKGFAEAQKQAGHILYYPAYLGDCGRFV